MRRWRQKQRQAEKMNICDSPRGLLLKIFLPLRYARTNLSLFVLFRSLSSLVLFRKLQGEFLGGEEKEEKRKKKKPSAPPSMAGTCPLRQVFPFASVTPHAAFKDRDVTDGGIFSIAVSLERRFPSLCQNNRRGFPLEECGNGRRR